MMRITLFILLNADDTSDCSLPPPGLLPAGAHPRCHDGLDLHDHCCRVGARRHCLCSFHPAQGAKKTKRQKDKKTKRQREKKTKRQKDKLGQGGFTLLQSFFKHK